MPWFGELAVWLNKPQGGTAKALMHTSCLALRHDDFLRFVQIMPEFRSCLNKKAKFWKGVTSQHSKDGHGVMQEAEELRVRPPRACALACVVHACMPAPTLMPPPPSSARPRATGAQGCGRIRGAAFGRRPRRLEARRRCGGRQVEGPCARGHRRALGEARARHNAHWQQAPRRPAHLRAVDVAPRGRVQVCEAPAEEEQR